MAQETLLEIVQSVMLNMNRASVSSIFDLEESESVANMAKDIYNLIINEADWPHLHKIIQLGSAGDNTRPNYLVLPQNLTEVKEIRYNIRTSTATKDYIVTIPKITPIEFLNLTQSRDSSSVNTTEVTDFSGAKYQIYNNCSPKYCTSFDDEYIAFDAYDSAVDDCLQASKSTAIALCVESFTIDDSFVPDLPDKMFPYFKEKLNDAARSRLHGETIPFDVREIRKQKARLYGTSSRTNINKRLDYGRH